MLDPLQQLVELVRTIAQDLDPSQYPARLVQANLSSVLEGLRLFVFATGDPLDPGRPFVQARPIRIFLPLTQAAADLALTVAVGWGFFRIIFAHGFRNQHTLRYLLPRTVLAVVLINFAGPLVQAGVDACNALTQAVLAADATDHLQALRTWFTDLGAPGLQPLAVAALFVSYGLLALVYVVRFALLVVLTLLAPVAALLFVLPETHHYAREWGSLFVTTLLMQPLQLFVLQVGFALEASFESNSVYPVRHLFALAAVLIAFKVPGALNSASRVGNRAASYAKREAEHALHAAVHLASRP